MDLNPTGCLFNALPWVVWPPALHEAHPEDAQPAQVVDPNACSSWQTCRRDRRRKLSDQCGTRGQSKAEKCSATPCLFGTYQAIIQLAQRALLTYSYLPLTSGHVLCCILTRFRLYSTFLLLPTTQSTTASHLFTRCFILHTWSTCSTFHPRPH